jgi:hypothetical protein
MIIRLIIKALHLPEIREEDKNNNIRNYNWLNKYITKFLILKLKT